MAAPVRTRLIRRVANSPLLLGALLVGELFVAALLYMVAEGRSFWDSIWWSIVTGATVGYGDTYPVTPVGRIVGCTLILTTVLLLIPLVTAHFASMLIVDRDTFSHEEQEEIKQTVSRIERLLVEGYDARQSSFQRGSSSHASVRSAAPSNARAASSGES